MSPRPRRSQEVVLEATLDVIAEQGVMGISVDTVAARSGVSKATIYRHWGSRARLIHAAISSLQPTTVEPNTGSLRDDLVVLLLHLVEYFDTPKVAEVFPSFLDAAVRDPGARRAAPGDVALGSGQLRARRASSASRAASCPTTSTCTSSPTSRGRRSSTGASWPRHQCERPTSNRSSMRSSPRSARCRRRLAS